VQSAARGTASARSIFASATGYMMGTQDGQQRPGGQRGSDSCGIFWRGSPDARTITTNSTQRLLSLCVAGHGRRASESETLEGAKRAAQQDRAFPFVLKGSVNAIPGTRPRSGPSSPVGLKNERGPLARRVRRGSTSAEPDEPRPAATAALLGARGEWVRRRSRCSPGSLARSDLGPWRWRFGMGRHGGLGGHRADFWLRMGGCPLALLSL